MKIRVAYTKKKEARYIAHLDLTRVFDRALRRTGIEVAYSEGFNPHPKIAFGPPLPVGVEGEREYVDIGIKVTSDNDEHSFVDKALQLLQKQLPEGIEIVDFSILPQGNKALMAVINQACYRAEVPFLEPIDVHAFTAACEDWLAREEVLSIRNQKGKKVTRNIRPFVRTISVLSQESPLRYWLRLDIKTGNDGSVRPVEVLESISTLEGIKIDLDGLFIIRDGVYILKDDGEQLTPLDY
ncbi:MAG: hypothetical protein APF84_05245 [Gracilibacter sp. BRH_c7a]|nr:MAG: hypothetical protein APF84_05245 [Gracilibacter sp. BRH_c7a]